MTNYQQIRQRNLTEAHKLGYLTNSNLPLLDEIRSCQSLKSATDRFLSLHAVIACSHGFPKDRAIDWLDRENLLGALTQREKEYVNTKTSPALDASVQWHVESLWALGWCIGCHDEFDFAVVCSQHFIEMIPDIVKGESTKSFAASLKLRGKSEILANADLAYCLHWAVMDAEIRGLAVPGTVSGRVVSERRRALEWMIGDDNWDEVQMDT